MTCSLQDRYRLYVCPECGEQAQYAGWCAFCHSRLEVYAVVPVERILRELDEIGPPVAKEIVSRFVDRLLTSSPVTERG